APEPAVEFVAVPSLGRDLAAPLESPRRPGERDSFSSRGGVGTAVAPRLRSVRGGAGLEVDLGAHPRVGQIPAEVRAALPGQGLVNYLEARAVVQALEALVADPTFRRAAAEWQGERAGVVRGHCPTVAVVALYQAQVELIKLLVERVP